MASIGHVAVGMAAARWRSTRGGAPPGGGALALSMLLWSGLSMLPDADVIGFALGVRYGDPWGHRGATHSFVFSIALGTVLGLAGARSRAAARGRGFARAAGATALLASLVLASHAVLDALTDGGRGCALYWPFSDERHFAPLRPIPVAPIGLGFLSARGLRVALVELVLFAPVLAYALWPRGGGRGPARPRPETPSRVGAPAP
jgi:inner membrane protein